MLSISSHPLSRAQDINCEAETKKQGSWKELYSSSCTQNSGSSVIKQVTWRVSTAATASQDPAREAKKGKMHHLPKDTKSPSRAAGKFSHNAKS